MGWVEDKLSDGVDWVSDELSNFEDAVKRETSNLEDEVRSLGRNFEDEVIEDFFGGYEEAAATVAAVVTAPIWGPPALAAGSTALGGLQAAGSAAWGGLQAAGSAAWGGLQGLGSAAMAGFEGLGGLQGLGSLLGGGGGVPGVGGGGGGGLLDFLGSVGQGVISNNATKDIIELQRDQFNRAIGLQEETRDLNLSRSQPYANSGQSALGNLSRAANSTDMGNLRYLNFLSRFGEGDLEPVGATLEEVNPLVSFVRDEGFRDIQELAAAEGRFNSDGTLKDLARFNTDLAATIVPQLQQQKFGRNLAEAEYNRGNRLNQFNQGVTVNQLQQAQQNQRFGRLFDVARLGANAVAGQNTTASSAANNIGNLSTQFSTNQSNALANRANVWSGTIQDLVVR